MGKISRRFKDGMAVVGVLLWIVGVLGVTVGFWFLVFRALIKYIWG